MHVSANVCVLTDSNYTRSNFHFQVKIFESMPFHVHCRTGRCEIIVSRSRIILIISDIFVARRYDC